MVRYGELEIRVSTGTTADLLGAGCAGCCGVYSAHHGGTQCHEQQVWIRLPATGGGLQVARVFEQPMAFRDHPTQPARPENRYSNRRQQERCRCRHDHRQGVPDRASSGHQVGIPTEPVANRQTVGTKDLVPELRRIIGRGLPASREAAGEVLINLRNIVARSTHPDDVYGRLDSLNETIECLLLGVDDEGLGQAARILFGVADGSKGTTLTVRRRQCAVYLQYDFDHFRKHVERRILDLVAEQIHRDLVQYRSRLGREVTAYETSRPTPPLTTKEITREEELLSRIWQHLYQVRAERIAVRLAEDDDTRRHHREIEEAAALRMNTLADEYVQTYGKTYISDGKLDYAIEGLERLVVWRV